MKTFEDALTWIKNIHEIKEVTVGHNKNGIKITFVQTTNGNLYMIKEVNNASVQMDLLN